WNTNMQSIASCLEWMGRANDLSKVLPEVMEQARERGDRTSETLAKLTGGLFLQLCADRPDDAAERVESAMAKWSQSAVDLTHFCAAVARARIALYRGRPSDAYRIMAAPWGALTRYGYFRIQAFRVIATFTRTLAALGAAGSRPDDSHLRIAERGAQK